MKCDDVAKVFKERELPQERRSDFIFLPIDFDSPAVTIETKRIETTIVFQDLE